jgi:NAD+-dependent protein deacetylase sirtuin 4
MCSSFYYALFLPSHSPLTTHHTTMARRLLYCYHLGSRYSPAYAQRLFSSVGHGAFVPRTLSVPVAERQETLLRLIDLVHSKQRVLVISGAGLSTESHIPDYRGEFGSYSHGHKPTLYVWCCQLDCCASHVIDVSCTTCRYQTFVASTTQRKRYWARSMVGYSFFARAMPHAGHRALRRLSMASPDLLLPLVTQNVDGLLQKAGFADVLELHGNGHYVQCQSCMHLETRTAFHSRLMHANAEFLAKYPAFAKSLYESHAAEPYPNLDEDLSAEALQELDRKRKLLRADADANVTAEDIDFDDLKLVSCINCLSSTAILKPSVVFFGETLPTHVSERASQLVTDADMLLVLGSSLQVFSAFRLARLAHSQGKPIAIVNIGPTRADSLATLKLESHCGTTLEALCAVQSHDCDVV